VEAKEMDNAQQLHILIDRKAGSCSLGNQSMLFQTQQLSQSLANVDEVQMNQPTRRSNFSGLPLVV
jgi:hypothetical protein